MFLFKMDPLQAADDSSVWIIDRGNSLEMALDRGSRDGHGSIFTDIHNIHP